MGSLFSTTTLPFQNCLDWNRSTITRPLLLVEDDLHIRAVLVEFLELDGLDVLEMSTAEAAMLFLKDGGKPCMVVTDINLGPGVNGVELADKTHEVCPDVPVVFITGRMDMLHLRGLHQGEHAVAKPFALSTLMETMRRVLNETKYD